MKTFVAHDVMRDHTPGMVVVSAVSLNKAKLIVMNSDVIQACYKGEVCENLKELPPNSVDYVMGGG